MDIAKRQPQLFRQFEKLLTKHSLSHAYLFDGPKGTGKQAMAIWLAQCLFCERPNGNHLACGNCTQCQRIATFQHPDVIEIVPEGQSIKVDEMRYLKAELSKSGMESAQKVFIISDAEKMTNSAANSLLKFIEEPNQKMFIFLLTTAKAKILPTIISRCQVVAFPTLVHKNLMHIMMEAGLSKEQASLLSRLTQDIDKALELSQDEWFIDAKEKIIQWFTAFMKQDDIAFIMVQQEIVPHFKEKEQQTLALDLLMLAYQDLLFYQSQASDEYSYPSLINRVYEHYPISLKKLNIQLEKILNCKRKVDANVGFQGVLEQLSLHLLDLVK